MYNIWWVDTQTHTHIYTLWNNHHSKLTSPSFQLFLEGGGNTQDQPYQPTPKMVTAPPRHRRKTRVIVPGASCSWTRSCKWAQVPTVHSLGLGLVLPLTHITPSHALEGGACAHPFNTVPLLSDHWPLLSQPWPQPTPQQPSSFTSFESDPRSWWLLLLRLHTCPCPLL